MSKDYNEESKVNTGDNTSEGEYAYKKVIVKNKEKKRTWSVASLVLALISFALMYFGWVSLTLAVISVGCGLISRKNLGYFDKISLAGIIIGIFALVFSGAGLIFADVIAKALGF